LVEGNGAKAHTEGYQALLRTERLEQSILIRAFRGELLPQDPNDEPASTLLDRIHVQRIRSSTAKMSTVSHRKGKKYQKGK